MALCSGIKADGTRCKAQAMHASAYCVGHDPDQAEARRLRASKGGRRGGRGRPASELEDIKATLYRIASEIEEGAIDTRTGAVLVQVYNSIRGCVEDQRKLKETEELERRLEELEQALEGQPGPRRYGA